jgi:hypothetical protein
VACNSPNGLVSTAASHCTCVSASIKLSTETLSSDGQRRSDVGTRIRDGPKHSREQRTLTWNEASKCTDEQTWFCNNVHVIVVPTHMHYFGKSLRLRDVTCFQEFLSDSPDQGVARPVQCLSQTSTIGAASPQQPAERHRCDCQSARARTGRWLHTWSLVCLPFSMP